MRKCRIRLTTLVFCEGIASFWSVCSARGKKLSQTVPRFAPVPLNLALAQATKRVSRTLIGRLLAKCVPCGNPVELKATRQSHTASPRDMTLSRLQVLSLEMIKQALLIVMGLCRFLSLMIQFRNFPHYDQQHDGFHDQEIVLPPPLPVALLVRASFYRGSRAYQLYVKWTAIFDHVTCLQQTYSFL
jgi:hypothetical protein